jgi:serine O-acetyltransferase
MINLLRLIHLHFDITLEKEIRILLDKSLSLEPEELAIYIYRLQNEIINIYGEDRGDILYALSYIQRMYTQIEIYYSAKIGENFKIVHGLGTVIGARVKIGNNVTIYQNVTIGDNGDNSGRPRIASNVIVYAGAKIIGNVDIGENSIIGANSLVRNSFPCDSVIVGIPAKLVSKKS